MISELTFNEIGLVFGGDGPVEPFCPDGFKLGTISYDAQGQVTGWTCVNASDGRSWFGTAADWVTWAIQSAIESILGLF